MTHILRNLLRDDTYDGKRPTNTVLTQMLNG
jgi:hypothetical protein